MPLKKLGGGVRKLRDKKTDTRPCIITVKEKVCCIISLGAQMGPYPANLADSDPHVTFDKIITFQDKLTFMPVRI